MVCLQCKSLDLQKYPNHSKAGIGRCEHEALAGTFVSLGFKRQCSKFMAADAAVSAKRIEWYGRKG
jgi:hypothetical protein